MINIRNNYLVIFEASALRSGSLTSTELYRKDIHSMGVTETWECFKIRPSIHIMMKEIRHIACIDSDTLLVLNKQSLETY